MRNLNPDSGINLFILERTDMGVNPQQVMSILTKVQKFSKGNKHVLRNDILAEVDLCDGLPIVEVYSSIIKPPNAFIDGRVYLDGKYIYPDELLCIMSS